MLKKIINREIGLCILQATACALWKSGQINHDTFKEIYIATQKLSLIELPTSAIEEWLDREKDNHLKHGSSGSTMNAILDCDSLIHLLDHCEDILSDEICIYIQDEFCRAFQKLNKD